MLVYRKKERSYQSIVEQTPDEEKKKHASILLCYEPCFHAESHASMSTNDKGHSRSSYFPRSCSKANPSRKMGIRITPLLGSRLVVGTLTALCPHSPASFSSPPCAPSSYPGISSACASLSSIVYSTRRVAKNFFGDERCRPGLQSTLLILGPLVVPWLL